MINSSNIFQLENTTSARVAIRNALFEVINIIYGTENTEYPGGCLVVLSLLESSQHNKDTKKILDDVLIQIRDAVSARLKQGEENNEFEDEFTEAEIAQKMGANVTLISGPVNLSTPKNVQRINTRSAMQMHQSSFAELDECDIFIACAAVADYRPMQVESQKMKKQQEEQAKKAEADNSN